jgi:hypothetical protein
VIDRPENLDCWNSWNPYLLFVSQNLFSSPFSVGIVQRQRRFFLQVTVVVGLKFNPTNQIGQKTINEQNFQYPDSLIS